MTLITTLSTCAFAVIAMIILERTENILKRLEKIERQLWNVSMTSKANDNQREAA